MTLGFYIDSVSTKTKAYVLMLALLTAQATGKGLFKRTLLNICSLAKISALYTYIYFQLICQ